VALSVARDELVEDRGGDGNFSPDAKIVPDATGKITGLRLLPGGLTGKIGIW